MSQYDKLQKEYEALKDTEHKQLEVAYMGMREIAEDSRKTADTYKNPEKVLAEIDEQFEKATQLGKADITFLFFAIALQCVRQYLFTNRDKRESDQEAAKHTKGHSEEHSNRKFEEWFLPSIPEIISNPVPFDATRQNDIVKKQEALKGAGNLGHRLVLGHDPILGWIFGTSNIATSTLTNWKMDTYHVRSTAFKPGAMAKVDQLTSSVPTLEMLRVAFERFFQNGINGWSVLAASLQKEWVHLKSDIGTKNSLPFPVIATISPEMANKFAEYGLDMGNISAVSKQAFYAEAINIIIGMLHGMYCFYSQKTELPDGAKLCDATYFRHLGEVDILELSKVRTRKILLLSNLLATSSNVIAVAVMEVAAAYGHPEWASKGWDYLDIGGLAVTLYRLIADTKFIADVKNEFLEKAWYNKVVGSEYQFIAEVKEMSKKDIQKGIAIQAKADADKAVKLADGMEVHTKVLSDIRDTQNHVRNSVDVVLQDKVAQEAELLFGLRANKKVSDLGHTEQRVLGATLYTLMANSQNVSELQKQFYRGVEQYGISERIDSFNFSNLKNIDSFSDRKIILKAICAFLFLHDCNTAFKDDVQFNWLAEFTSTDDVDCVCQEIAKEFSVLGGEGLMLGYIPPSELLTDQLPEIEVIEDGSEDSDIDEDEGEFDYSFLYEIIGRYTDNEQAFGKKFKPKQAFLDREFGKEHPGLSPSGVIAATKVSNGYLLFTTYAIYLKTGSSLRGRYVCLPYEKILSDKISAGVGKVKGTRKLVIPYLSSENEIAVVEVDDKKIEEEKLRELILEITKSGGTFPKTDRVISFESLKTEMLVDYLSILATILHTEGHSLTEVYLMTKDCGLDEEWENIVDFIPVEEVTQWIDDFLNEIPYPSECEISNEGMALCIRTLCRTNILEGNDATVLSQFEEHCAKQFDMMDLMPDAVFSILLEHCSKDIRELDIEELLDIKAGLSDNTSFADAIGNDLEMMIGKLQAKEEAKRNTPAAKLTRVIQDGAIPVAKGIASKLKGK